MKLKLESTSKIVMLKTEAFSEGVPARIWEGETEYGIKVHAFITRLAVNKELDTREFESQLIEHNAPSPEIEAIPNRLIL